MVRHWVVTALRMLATALVLVFALAQPARADIASPMRNPLAVGMLLLAGVVVIAVAVIAVVLIVRLLRRGRRDGKSGGPVPPQGREG